MPLRLRGVEERLRKSRSISWARARHFAGGRERVLGGGRVSDLAHETAQLLGLLVHPAPERAALKKRRSRAAAGSRACASSARRRSAARTSHGSSRVPDSRHGPSGSDADEVDAREGSRRAASDVRGSVSARQADARRRVRRTGEASRPSASAAASAGSLPAVESSRRRSRRRPPARAAREAGGSTP